MTAASLPLPRDADLGFWRSEIDRAGRLIDTYAQDWTKNVQWYTGQSPDAQAASAAGTEFVNVNVDFYQVEQKLSQLFYETPELQISGTGPLKGQDAILQAHRALLNELLGPNHADVLFRAVHPAIKDCLLVSQAGPVLIGYQPTLKAVSPPAQLGTMLGLQADIQVPIHEQWYAYHFSRKKLLTPADFTDTDWDRAPWLGMRFRMPLAVAIRERLVPPDFTGTNTRDEHVLDEATRSQEPSGLNYVDGQALWYRASLFDVDAIHPELFRELVLIDGLDREARHRDSPHQTIGPNGRMTADSMIGNPIHPLTIRSVPDSAIVPSDSQMTRPLVRELCKFRTQMVQERDANRPRILYDSEKFPPDVLAKIVNGTIGDMIGLEPGGLAAGVNAIMAVVQQGTSPRQTYIANDYITTDIAKTLALDATGAGVKDDENESATKTAAVERNRGVRLAHEQRQVLRWYLKLVDKFSALVCRYMTPQLAVPYIGQEAAAAWAQWDKKATDGRMAFSAKPDSQIRLDAQAERKFMLDLYQFTAKDPNVVRIELLKELFAAAGKDPSKLVVEQLPEKHPEPTIGFTFKGEDLIGPQAPLVREILAQGGIQLSQPAIDDSSGQLFKQITLGLRDASGKATPAVKQPMEHGGTAEQVRPLSQQSADLSGQRSGPKTEAA